MLTKVAIVAVLSLFSWTLHAQQEQSQADRGVIFSGLIFPARPVVSEDPQWSVDWNMTVYMDHDGGLVVDSATIPADAGGRFRMQLPVHPREMIVWADGYAPARFVDGQIRRNDGSYSLYPFEELRGRVFLDGAPIHDALIHAYHAGVDDGYVPGWMIDSLEVQYTDSIGSFIIPDVIPNLRVIVQASHVRETASGPVMYASKLRDLPPSSMRSEEPIELTLAPVSDTRDK
ncbi:MAG: hypothetical protein OXU81_10820 [Gammaproteobacteria bacterium]|nr:hypothetical protein [Gammaproteobacteria bacterium]